MSVPESSRFRRAVERKRHWPLRRGRTPARLRTPGFELLEPRQLLSGQSVADFHPSFVLHRNSDGSTPASTSSPTGLTPTQVRHAYGFDQITIGGVQGDGTGQTIAIIDAYDAPTIQTDLIAFDAHWGIPDPPSFIRVAQNGSTNYPGTDPAGAGNANGTWEMETALDVEWAHTLAPGASILLVEATSPSNANLMTAAVGYAKSQPNVSLITMSFGQSEFSGETSFDSLFTTPSGHIGITFLASTGDFGQPSGYPAYSPNVVAVGGTTLSVDGSGNYLGESGWSGSGGGVSTMENQPAYQSGIVNQYSTTRRTNPDISFDADPNSGVSVYDSWDFGTSAPWQQFGGTSFSSPSWAALLAIADQARVAAGLGTLDGPSQTLPKLYGLTGGDFNDVMTGNNGFAAGPNYDLVTGRGTPKAALVVNDLVGAYTVTSSNPANGAIVSTPPADFAITLATPYDPNSVLAADLTVDGVPADSFTLTNSTTITFHFNASPVTTQGLQTMAIAAGAITRQTDEAPVSAFSASFRYDQVVIVPDSTTPAGGASITLPLNSLTVHFNEPYAPSSISTSDLTLSQGSVSGFTLVDPQTVTYNLTGISNAGTLTVSIAAGAIADAFGNLGAAFSESFTLIKPPVAFPTPLAAVTPAGSLVYQNSASGSIASGSSDTYTLAIAAGQTLTLIVTPASSLRAQVALSGPGVSTSATSSAAGAPAVLETVAIGTTGTYTFVVSGVSGTTGSYTIKAYLNAAVSTATVGGASNHTIATAQNIDGSFVTLSGSSQRGAAMGTITSSIGPDGFGYSGIAITPQFVDISGTGTAILQGADDSYQRLRSSSNLSGFSFKLYSSTYTSFYVNSNGMITFGSGLTGTSSFSNSDLTTTPSQATIAPLWDDWIVTGGTQSAVYYQVQGSGASQRLIIQWNDLSAFQLNQTGQVTFQVILNADGTMIFNYKNLASGDSAAGGATATVGIKDSGTQGNNRLLVSFNSASSPYVGTGKSLEIGVGLTTTATDVYAFSLAAGQAATLAATGQKSAAVSVSLENAQGTVLASGSSPGNGATVNSLLSDYVATTAGTYYAVVTGTTGASYTLIVNRDADFGAETNGSFSAAQTLGSGHGVLGAILASPATPTENWYSINLNAGDSIELQTFTPGDSGGAQFANALVPRIQIYSPADALVASGQGSVNQSLTATAAATGSYRIRVFGNNSTSGEYYLSEAIDASPPTASITAVSPSPRNTPVSSLQIVFSEPVSGVTISSFSLTNGSGPNLLTSSQTLTTSDNITYTLGNLAGLTGASGSYTLSLPASSNITDSSGGFLASGTTVTFIIDTTPPTVAIVPVSPALQQLPVGQIEIDFSEPIAGFSLSSLTLSHPGGANLLTASQTLSTSDDKTFLLGNLSGITGDDGQYVVNTVTAGVTDLAGNPLGTGASISFTVDAVLPAIQGVYTASADWNSSFTDYLAASAVGDSQLGYQLTGGSTQLAPLPWTGMTMISVVFTKDVSIDFSDPGIKLVGSAGAPDAPSLAAAAHSYDPATHTAQWTLTEPLATNQYQLEIPSTAVSDAIGVPLDGDWTNATGTTAGGQFPSGDGQPGGDFDFRFNVLVGDVNQDAAVSGVDGNAVRSALLSAAGDSSGPAYSPFADLNGDGAVTGLDGAIVRMHLLDTLPDPAPGGSSTGLVGNAAAQPASAAIPANSIAVPSVLTAVSSAAVSGAVPSSWTATAPTSSEPSIISPAPSSIAVDQSHNSATPVSLPKPSNPIDEAILARDQVFETLGVDSLSTLDGNEFTPAVVVRSQAGRNTADESASSQSAEQKPRIVDLPLTSTTTVNSPTVARMSATGNAFGACDDLIATLYDWLSDQADGNMPLNQPARRRIER